MDDIDVKPGETVRVSCDDCDTEWDVTLEPKAKGTEGEGLSADTVEYCPGCGSSNLTPG